MPTSSISGLASGLDTAGIIDQLMQLEAISQNRLKTQQSTQKSVLAALQALNTDVASLATKAEALAKPATWQTLKATSTNTAITATAGATATATSLSVTVKQLATTGQTVYGTAATLNTVVTTGSPVVLTAASGQQITLDNIGTGTLKELADGINAKKAGVTASTVRTGTDTYQLLITADTAGAGSAITLSNVGGLGTETAVAGVGAEVTVAGILASSSTNTFTDLTPGVTLTLGAAAKVGDTSTITVAQDAGGVKASVKGLVDQLNALLTKIDTQTANASGGTTTAGVLAGDSTARSLRSALLDTVFGSSGTTSMASIGIQTDRYGKLVFDEAKFDAAYTADPTGVMKQFTVADTSADPNVAHPDGWAALVQKAAKNASDPYTGTITSAIKGRQTTIDRLGDDITDWDDRLALRRESLTRQYTALETALSSLQSQGNWLAGQLASLPTSSSS